MEKTQIKELKRQSSMSLRDKSKFDKLKKLIQSSFFLDLPTHLNTKSPKQRQSLDIVRVTFRYLRQYLSTKQAF